MTSIEICRKESKT